MIELLLQIQNMFPEAFEDIHNIMIICDKCKSAIIHNTKMPIEYNIKNFEMFINDHKNCQNHLILKLNFDGNKV